MRQHNGVKYILLLTKLTISIILLRFAFSTIDFGKAISDLERLSFVVVVSVLLVLILQFVVAGFRQSAVIEMCGHRLAFRQSIETVLIGVFFSQTFISFFGGDAMRIWRLKELGLGLRAVTRAILLDRIVGFLGIIALVVGALPATLSLVNLPVARWGLIALAVAGTVAGIVFLLVGFVPSQVREMRYIGSVMDLATVSRHVLAEPRLSSYAFAHSVVIHLINVVAIYVIASGFSVSITLQQCMVLVPPVLLISMLPISVAGWGAREGAMVVAFSFVGVAAEQALVTSVSFGLALLVVSMVGGLIWLVQRQRNQQPDQIEA